MQDFKLNEEELVKQQNNKILVDIFNKATNNIQCSKEDIQQLYDFNRFFVNQDYEEDGRWSKYCYIVINLFNKYFSFYYQQGLTENQPNEYDEQILELVQPHKRTIEILEWK